MAAGTQTTYALNLDDIIAFPDSAHSPVLPPEPGESWFVLTQARRLGNHVEAQVSWGRPIFRVRDKIGTQFIVAFYTEDADEDSEGCHIGGILAVKNARLKHFMDGQLGIRVNEASDVENIPCSLSELWALNQQLKDRSDSGLLISCINCDLPAAKQCTNCQTKYCTRDCQAADWKNHKHKCKALKLLHQWNRTDWG
ncbi:hypothetical protein FIBSPDRAFT_784215 [Athelia psychrophila]|uniref:MYND-type domain-containing protein n=1 Tax=Athelia psychrophila TaxID=1759441 RepID=A0A166NBS0_9AGAM|nr:hypothetical protein FIBSPDRAFT_784215 [Fibularhizoctonia sp. CBS 109695]